jgi:hypothetical protein
VSSVPRGIVPFWSGGLSLSLLTAAYQRRSKLYSQNV